MRLLPLIMFMVVASMINGFLMPRYGWISVWYIGGSTLALIGTALMCKSFSYLPSAIIGPPTSPTTSKGIVFNVFLRYRQ